VHLRTVVKEQAMSVVGLNMARDQKALERVDVRQDLRTVDLVMADLAVSTVIVRDHRVAKVALKDLLAEKDARTEIVDRLDQKAKADRSDAKLL
jgi:hypothetical protein